MKKCIWYISKYVAIPASGEPVSRPVGILTEATRRGMKTLLITASSNYQFAHPDHGQETDYRTPPPNGMEVIRVATLSFKSRRSIRRILSWISFEVGLAVLPKSGLPKPDVIIVSSLSLLTVLNGLALKKRYGCRLIFEVRDIWPLTLVEELGFKATNPLVRVLALIERLGYRHSDAIVGTMPNLGAHVDSVIGPGRMTYCIPMGVDPSDIIYEEPFAKSGTTVARPGQFVVGYAGSISMTNALSTLLECARGLADNDTISFTLIGDGDLRADYERQFGNLPNVSFGGAVPRAQVHSFLTQCDILYFAVHPSHVWDYGLSLNKLIDYMMAGKPIIASYSGFQSMINEAKCGSFVPAGDVDALRTEILRFKGLPPSQLSDIGSRGRAWLLANRTYSTLTDAYLRIMFPDEDLTSSERADG